MDRPDAPPACANCGAAVAGAYCSDCGQDSRRGRLRARDLLGDAFRHVTAFDTSLARTLRGLALRPGRLAADYVEGRRIRYTNPLSFLLGATAVFLVTFRFLGMPLDAALGMGAKIEDGAGVAGPAAAVRGFIIGHMDLVVILALPAVAVVQGWLFRGRGRNYAENLVYLVYLQGQLLLYGAVLLGLGAWRPEVVVPARMLCHLALLSVGNRGFYGTGWPRSVILGVIGTAGYLLVTGSAAGLIAAGMFAVRQ